MIYQIRPLSKNTPSLVKVPLTAHPDQKGSGIRLSLSGPEHLYLLIMKKETMKPLFQSLFTTLVIACILTSCSKKNDSNNKVTVQDLQDHYIVAINTDKGVQRLSVIYFTKDGSNVNAVLDQNGLRRQLPLSIQDNRFVYDVNSNGASVFTFNVKKDGNGIVSIYGADYKRDTDPQSKIDHAEIMKVSDAPVFAGKVFTYYIPSAVGDTKLLFEAGNKWHYEDEFEPRNLHYSYYVIGNGIGWKSEDAASEGISLGVVVPQWEGKGPLMLLQTSIERIDESRIHAATKD